MKGDVQRYVVECKVCQRMKYATISLGGLPQPLSILAKIWEDYSMDFIMSLLEMKRTNTILVVIDRLSKNRHLMIVQHPFSDRLHSFPHTFVTNKDSISMSKLW